MWSTGNFIKGDFPLALVIALRINIFLASRMNDLQGVFFLWNKTTNAKPTVCVLPLSLLVEAVYMLNYVLHIFGVHPEITVSVNIPHKVGNTSIALVCLCVIFFSSKWPWLHLLK